MEDQDPRDLGHAAPRRGPPSAFARGSAARRRVPWTCSWSWPSPSPRPAPRSPPGTARARRWIVVLFALAATLPLLVRRRWPFAVLACIFAAGVLSPASLPYALPLVVGSTRSGPIARGRRRSRPTASCWRPRWLRTRRGIALRPRSTSSPSRLLGAIAAGAGIYIGGKRTSITTLEGETARLARERQLLAERAVAEERVRIAQELHDVIAHNVSLIVVQAQALGATHADEQVTAATDGIADLGRRTMAEMHRTLRLLRARDDAPEFAPQPGLGGPGQAAGAVPRRRTARRARGRRRAAPARAERRPLGVPHRARGAHQRRQARRPRAHRGDDHLRARGAGAHDRRQRQPPRTRRRPRGRRAGTA